MSFAKFISKQIIDIKKGGFKAFFKKIKILLIFILILPLHVMFFPLFILIILISPFAIIRIGKFGTYLFGNLAAIPELYCCTRDERKASNGKHHIDLFFFKINDYVSNKQLKKMWKKELVFLPALILQPIHNINIFISKFIPQLKKHDINNEILNNNNRDTKNLFEKYQTHLKFNKDEEENGKKILKQLGLPVNAKFVCIGVRDRAYSNKSRPKKELGFWDYHNFRDGNIDDFILSAEEIVKRGYWVFRIGKTVEKKLGQTNPKIIDYASSDLRSDFMDIYIQAKCSFCLSLSSGLDQVSYVFRKPVAHIEPMLFNFFSFNPKHVTLFRHFFLKKENRNLSISEIFSHNLAFAKYAKEYENKGVELKHNSAEEIRDLAIEVLERYEGKWVENSKDKELKQKFWKIYMKNYRKYVPDKHLLRIHNDNFNSHISAKFLRENESWLQ